MGPTLIGEDIAWPPPHEFKRSKELREFGEDWFKVLQGLLDEEKITTHPLKIMSGALEDVLVGMETVKAGKVSDKKLVYRLV